MAIPFQPNAFQPDTFEVTAFGHSVLRLALTDARQLRAALTDARQFQVTVADARQLRAALTVGALPDTMQGAVRTVAGRIPLLSTTGRAPPAWGSPWGLGGGTTWPVIVDASVELRAPEPAHYAPGALRPENAQGFTIDTIRVTDSLGVHRDLFVWFHATRPDFRPAAQALDVTIGMDGVAAMVSGGELALTASGGTGPYTWDFAHNRSGGTLTPEGAYVAGPAVGIDRLRVTDSLGAIGLVQAEVIAGQLGADMVVDPDPQVDLARHSAYGFMCIPYAKVWGEGGTAPYSVAMQDDQTGATITAPQGRRVAFTLRALVDGAPGAALDLTGWSFDAKLYGQRGGTLASGMPVTVTGNVVEVEIPEPGELLFTPAVLRVEAETAGSILSLGYPTVALETLLIAQEA